MINQDETTLPKRAVVLYEALIVRAFCAGT